MKFITLKFTIVKVATELAVNMGKWVAFKQKFMEEQRYTNCDNDNEIIGTDSEGRFVQIRLPSSFDDDPQIELEYIYPDPHSDLYIVYGRMNYSFVPDEFPTIEEQIKIWLERWEEKKEKEKEPEVPIKMKKNLKTLCKNFQQWFYGLARIV